MFGVVCEDDGTLAAMTIAGPTDGSTDIVHRERDQDYQVPLAIDGQYGAGYVGISCECKILFNPATGVMKVDCADTTATGVDVCENEDLNIAQPILVQGVDSETQLLNNTVEKSLGEYNQCCYVCNDPDTGDPIYKPVVHVPVMHADEYLNIEQGATVSKTDDDEAFNLVFTNDEGESVELHTSCGEDVTFNPHKGELDVPQISHNKGNIVLDTHETLVISKSDDEDNVSNIDVAGQSVQLDANGTVSNFGKDVSSLHNNQIEIGIDSDNCNTTAIHSECIQLDNIPTTSNTDTDPYYVLVQRNDCCTVANTPDMYYNPATSTLTVPHIETCDTILTGVSCWCEASNTTEALANMLYVFNCCCVDNPLTPTVVELSSGDGKVLPLLCVSSTCSRMYNVISGFYRTEICQYKTDRYFHKFETSCNGSTCIFDCSCNSGYCGNYSYGGFNLTGWCGVAHHPAMVMKYYDGYSQACCCWVGSMGFCCHHPTIEIAATGNMNCPASQRTTLSAKWCWCEDGYMYVCCDSSIGWTKYGSDIFVGTKAEWEDVDQTKYKIALLTDTIGSGLEITNSVTSGNYNPVSADAVYQCLNSIVSGDAVAFVNTLPTTYDNKIYVLNHGAVYLGDNACNSCIELATYSCICDIENRIDPLEDDVACNSCRLDKVECFATGNATLNSSVITGGYVTWIRCGSVVTVKVNAIENNTTGDFDIASGLPKPKNGWFGWGTMLNLYNNGHAALIQVSTDGVLTTGSGINVDANGAWYGTLTYITCE